MQRLIRSYDYSLKATHIHLWTDKVLVAVGRSLCSMWRVRFVCIPSSIAHVWALFHVPCHVGRYNITWYTVEFCPYFTIFLLFSPRRFKANWFIYNIRSSKLPSAAAKLWPHHEQNCRLSGTEAGFPIDAGTLRRWSLPAPGEPARPASPHGHSRSPRSLSSPTPTRLPVEGAHRASSRMLLAAPPRSRGVRETGNTKPLHITSDSSKLGYNRAGTSYHSIWKLFI